MLIFFIEPEVIRVASLQRLPRQPSTILKFSLLLIATLARPRRPTSRQVSRFNEILLLAKFS